MAWRSSWTETHAVRLRGDLVRGHDSDRIRWQSHDAVSRPDPDRRRRRRHLSCRHPGDAGVDRTESARVRPGNHARVRSPGQRADAAARRVADRPGHVARFVRRARMCEPVVGRDVGLVFPGRPRGTPRDHHGRTRTAAEPWPCAGRRETQGGGAVAGSLPPACGRSRSSISVTAGRCGCI